MQICISTVSPLDFCVRWLLRGAFICMLVLLLSGAYILKTPGQRFCMCPIILKETVFSEFTFSTLFFTPFQSKYSPTPISQQTIYQTYFFHYHQRYFHTLLPPSAPYLIPIKVQPNSPSSRKSSWLVHRRFSLLSTTAPNINGPQH